MVKFVVSWDLQYFFGNYLMRIYNEGAMLFTARCTLVQSAVLRSHVVCLSVCLSVRPSLRPSVCL